jgi:hypothetical protein
MKGEWPHLPSLPPVQHSFALPTLGMALTDMLALITILGFLQRILLSLLIPGEVKCSPGHLTSSQ